MLCIRIVWQDNRADAGLLRMQRRHLLQPDIGVPKGHWQGQAVVWFRHAAEAGSEAAISTSHSGAISIDRRGW